LQTISIEHFTMIILKVNQYEFLRFVNLYDGI